MNMEAAGGSQLQIQTTHLQYDICQFVLIDFYIYMAKYLIKEFSVFKARTPTTPIIINGGAILTIKLCFVVISEEPIDQSTIH